jgi:hypothetical protein
MSFNSLTGADTVVFYDSDFNPQMDRQCEDRLVYTIFSLFFSDFEILQGTPDRSDP